MPVLKLRFQFQFQSDDTRCFQTYFNSSNNAILLNNSTKRLFFSVLLVIQIKFVLLSFATTSQIETLLHLDEVGPP